MSTGRLLESCERQDVLGVILHISFRIKVHCVNGNAGAQWEKARELFELMQQQGCMPDVVTYTALISAYERGGKWQLALQVLLSC